MTRIINLTFFLNEDVTRDIFASKVALACAGGAMRPGERIRVGNLSGGLEFTIEERQPFEFSGETISVPRYSTRDITVRCTCGVGTAYEPEHHLDGCDWGETYLERK